MFENIYNHLIYSNFFYNFYYFVNSPFKFFKNKRFFKKQNIIAKNIRDYGFYKIENLDLKSLEEIKTKIFEKYKNKKVINPKKKYLTQNKIDDEDTILILNNFSKKNNFFEISKEYLGFKSIKTKYFFMTSKFNNENNSKLEGSQLFHTDGLTIKQIKIFINLNEISIDTGATEIVDKKNSKNIFKYSKKHKIISNKTEKIEEIFFNRNFSNYKIHSFDGPFGTTNIFDSSNCYHRGGIMKYGEKNSSYDSNDS